MDGYRTGKNRITPITLSKIPWKIIRFNDDTADDNRKK